MGKIEIIKGEIKLKERQIENLKKSVASEEAQIQLWLERKDQDSFWLRSTGQNIVRLAGEIQALEKAVQELRNVCFLLGDREEEEIV